MEKVGRAVSRSVRGSKPSKYNVKLFVEDITGLPDYAYEAQLTWFRGSRVTQTKPVKVKNGIATFNESISHTTTLYKKQDGSFEQKNYNFRVKVTRQNDDQTTNTPIIGKKIINISEYISDTKEEKKIVVQMDGEAQFPEGKNAKMSCTICSEFSADQTIDTESAISGLSGLGGAGSGPTVIPEEKPTPQKAAAAAVLPSKIPEEEVETVVAPVAAAPASVPASVPASSTVLDTVKGNLESSVGAVVKTEAYKKKAESLNLEETGKKIGEGVADAAFGEKKANEEEGETTVDATLSNQIGRAHV
eukprot:TRINITY_DN4264_c1_g2_i2.p1 TRINITY_DN4264_c1_g2~~TRINITY_DN4264_c1_g2_i2.p1  ORF type:complete len:304 (+),score=53.51 TRINITY_DN4264_c1_g2_i2:499-1410(+)